jgi:cell wall-associated NlpC family hydrolase
MSGDVMRVTLQNVLWRQRRVAPGPWEVTALLFAAIFVLAGCTGSAPRFRSGGRADDEWRYAAKIREEEAREDDKKVDLARMKKELSSRPAPSGTYKNLTPEGINRDKVLLDIVSFLGVPYEFGGRTKEGIDCSGFTSAIYTSAVETQLPRSTVDQYRMGAPITRDGLQFGDLVFFNTTGIPPSHVGIYIEDDLFAHASVSSGVTISSLESTYYNKRYIGARRITRQ